MKAEKVPTWLYHKEKGAKVHLLAPGATLPKGWRDTPWPQRTQSEKTPERSGSEAQ